MFGRESWRAPVIIAAVVGGFMLVDALADVWTGRATQRWPTAEGTVVESKLVREASGRGTDTVAQIRYLYTPGDGELRTGDAVWACACATVDEDARVVELYPVGAEVEVRYDPEDPSRAVLLAGTPAGLRTKLGIGAGLLVFALGYWLIRAGARARSRP